MPQEISAIVKKSCFLLKKSPPGAPYSGVPKSGKQPLAHLPRNALWHSVLQLAVFRLAKSGKTQRKRRQTAWPFVSSCGSSAILLDENSPVEGVSKLGISPLQGYDLLCPHVWQETYYADIQTFIRSSVACGHNKSYPCKGCVQLAFDLFYKVMICNPLSDTLLIL